ncbi:MAG TPA: hypothetical protein VIS06_08055 [Mycobacteriales bacterium]
MTDTRQARQTMDRPTTDYRREPRGTPGWVGFAGVMLLLAGAFQFIAGLTALLRESFFLVGTSGLLVHVGYTVWGWVHVALGGALFLIGLAALTGRSVARPVGVAVALAAAVVNLGFLAAFPFWVVTNIALDVIVLYALSARWQEFVGMLGTERGYAMAGGRPDGSHEGRGVRPGERSTTTSTTTTTTQQKGGDGSGADEEEARRITAERGRRQ